MNGPAAAALEKALAAAGFLCLGGFTAAGDTDLPALGTGAPARALLLVGSTGPTLWPKLLESAEFTGGGDDPMDRYTRRVLDGLAGAHGFEPLYPFDGPPYHPFQQWAMKCGGFSPSPMGVLAHEAYGPWAGFRAALLSPDPLTGTVSKKPEGPCPACRDKPCIAACPAEALSMAAGYDVPACRAHLGGDRAADCWTGCRARRACPYGAVHAQSPENALFHMERFIGL